MKRYGGWLALVLLLTLGGTYSGVRYFGSLAIGGGYEEGSGLSVQDDGTLLSTSTLKGTQFTSTVATGTAPLVVTSTTLVPNLHVAEADHATTADSATTAFDVSDDTNLTASSGIVRTDDTLTHDTAAGYKHVPTGGADGQALLSTGVSGEVEWSASTTGSTTPFYALDIGGGYGSGTGATAYANGEFKTDSGISASQLVVYSSVPKLYLYPSGSSPYYHSLGTNALSASRSSALPDFSGLVVVQPGDTTLNYIPKSNGDGTYTWAAASGALGDVETLTTAGGSGTAPVSDGAGGLAMTDIATETELGAKANTAHSHLDAEVADALTISGGTVNNTPIGASTPSTGAFSTLTTTGGVHVGGTSDPGTDNLIVDGTATLTGAVGITADLTVGVNGGSNRKVILNGAAGTYRSLMFQTAGVNRWWWGTTATTESGANAGTNFYLGAYDDVGTSIDAPISIARAAGGAITLVRPLASNSGIDTSGVYQAGSGNINLTNSTGNLLWAAMETPTVKETLILTAAGGEPTTTAGCAASAKKETTTNKRNYRSLDFDPGTDESAFWNVTTLPDNYAGGTFVVNLKWKAAGAGNVCWSIASVVSSHDDVYDVALGTPVTSTAAVTAAGDCVETTTSAMTAAGTPVAGDSLYVVVTRDANNASDTVAGDVELLGVTLDYVGKVSP